MNKNLLKEMILPSFWLFFFIAHSKLKEKNNKLENQNRSEIRKITGLAGNNNLIIKDPKIKFTNAVYLSGY